MRSLGVRPPGNVWCNRSQMQLVPGKTGLNIIQDADGKPVKTSERSDFGQTILNKKSQ